MKFYPLNHKELFKKIMETLWKHLFMVKLTMTSAAKDKFTK